MTNSFVPAFQENEQYTFKVRYEGDGGDVAWSQALTVSVEAP